MRLAKPHVDVGFMTNDWERAERFWRDDVGLPFEEWIRVGGGVRQYRFGCHGSVVKVNHARHPLASQADAPTVYRALRIASDRVTAPTALSHPDGVPVALVPTGHHDIVGIKITVASADPDEARRFWVDALGADDLTSGDPDDNRYRLGDTLIRCVHEPGLAPMSEREAVGLRYLTVQVFDVDAEHTRITGLGFPEAWAPLTLGTTARVSFVRDPDGGFVEISQRASLTGPLPTGPTA
ncbi:MAG: VOC family protein [Acidimicrobiia bacterium]|nr:VOC family protein [Acidimicrobiia bacterium]